MSKPICVLQSPIWTRSGYGDWALAVAKSLLRYDKFDLHIAPTIWGACSKKNLDLEINDPEGKALLDRIIKQNLPRQPEVFIQMTIPNEFATPAKFNIGMTAGIETTVPRAEWLEGLNRMNLNFVTSQHAKDIFANAIYNKRLPNGASEDLVVKSPMEVLFWGADTRIFKKTDEAMPTVDEALSVVKEDWAFLFVGQWTAGNMQADRKAIGWLIKTFLETFANTDNPPALILKTSGAQLCIMDKYECLNKINEVTGMVRQGNPSVRLPNIYLLHGELDEIEMNALYNHKKVKAHVSFTHGEGFGHPLLLATLSGKPVITPKWSGHLDFLNPKYAKFFPGQLNPIPDAAINDWFVKDARWFDVDYKEAGKVMKNLYQNYDEKLLSDYEKLRVENMEKFSYEAMDKVFHAFLDKYVPKFATEETIKLPPLKRIKGPVGGAAPLKLDKVEEKAPVTVTQASMTVDTNLTSSNPLDKLAIKPREE